MTISAPVLVFFLSLHQLYFVVVLVSWLTLHNAMVAVVLFRHSARRRRIRSLTHRPLFTPGWSLQEFAVIHGLECTAPPTKRAVWMRERCQDWWDRIVATNFNDNDWRENFRMSRHNFCHLVAAVAPFMSPCENYVRIPVPLDKRVAMALYKLASCGEYGIVANRFGVHKSTVKKFFYMFCQSVTTHLAKEYVKLPSANEAKKIAERFEAKCHLPQIFGAIDGTHIPIAAPKTGYRDFVNRKHWASYNVQAVVDDGGLFMNVSCRAPGSAHDSTALKMSALYKRSDNLVPHGFSMLRGTAIPFMLVGDPAYPLLPWIMKGYTGRLSREEESFNVYLSSAQNVVEQAFGRLKGRWRILLKRADIYYKFMPTVVIATCALHNFCETHSEGYDASWDQAVTESESVLFPQPSSRPRSGVRSEIRDLLKDHLAANFPLRRSTLV